MSGVKRKAEELGDAVKKPKIDIQAVLAQTKRKLQEIKLKKAALASQAGAAAAAIGAAGKPGAAPVPAPVLRPPAMLRPSMSPNNFQFAGVPLAAKAAERAKPVSLMVDAEGRLVDRSGKEVKLERRTELKANLRAKQESIQKRIAALQKRQGLLPEEEEEEEAASNPYFDDRIGVKSAERQSRAFSFADPGKYLEMAERRRAHAKLELLHTEIAEAAKKTGIATSTKLHLTAPTRDFGAMEVPDTEWWDAAILKADDSCTGYDAFTKFSGRERYSDEISALVQHPIQLEPPESRKVLPPQVLLTKKERKKLRKQKRKEAERIKIEKIQIGLEEAPAPKVKISNLMRVLGTEAVAGPSQVEALVRKQMALRQEVHLKANTDRQLTAGEKKAKKIKKLTAETSVSVRVVVFRVTNLVDSRSQTFKVKENAKQLYLTGRGVITDEISCVIVEGGKQGINKYKRLMLHRIKWHVEGDTPAEEDGKPPNSCSLVWEGTVQKRAFSDFELKKCRTQGYARELLAKYGVAHYLDLTLANAAMDGSAP